MIKQEKFSKLSLNICFLEYRKNCKGLKPEFELATVKESSVIEPWCLTVFLEKFKKKYEYVLNDKFNIYHTLGWLRGQQFDDSFLIIHRKNIFLVF